MTLINQRSSPPHIRFPTKGSQHKESELVKLEEAQLVLKRLLRLEELGLVVEALNRYQIDTNVFCEH